jgi:hypothetical protein
MSPFQHALVDDDPFLTSDIHFMSDYLSFFLLRSRAISARDSPAKSLRFWLFLSKFVVALKPYLSLILLMIPL